MPKNALGVPRIRAFAAEDRNASGTYRQSVEKTTIFLTCLGWFRKQGSRIRVCDPMLWVVLETSGSSDALLKPAKYETSAQTAGLF